MILCILNVWLDSPSQTKQRKVPHMQVLCPKTGYPIRPTSIFCAIQRRVLPNIADLIALCKMGGTLHIPTKFCNEWELLIGKVTSVTIFPDGVVVKFPQDITASPLKWPEAVLWIPKIGNCGILR